MSSDFRSSHNFPFLSEFSAEDRRLAERARSDLEESKKKSTEARKRKVDEIVENVRRQMHDLLGAENARNLRHVMQCERLTFRDLCQPPGGLTLDFVKANRSRKAKADRLLRQFGVGRDRMAKIGAEAQKKLHTILGNVDGDVVSGYNLALNLEAWKKLSPLHQFPLPWGGLVPPPEDPNDPHRWFLFRPPFFGFDWSSEFSTKGDFRINHEHIVSPPAGLVGNDVMMEDDDAGDLDAAWANVETRIAFGFEAPTAGLVEVLIDAQSSLATYYLHVEDEWGWSDSSTRQHNYLVLRVLHPNAPESSLALMDSFSFETSGNETKYREDLIRGQHYYTQLVSSGPVPGGQSVIIEVGTRSLDYSITNDMAIDSRSHYRWFINSVEVRIVP